MAVCIKDCIQNMNLVIGCTIGCSYCYARNNVRRFHMIDDFEKPEFFPNKLRLMEKKRPQNFLLTGMSDFSHWEPEWREQIFARIVRVKRKGRILEPGDFWWEFFEHVWIRILPARRIITGLYAICTRRRHPGDNESAKG